MTDLAGPFNSNFVHDPWDRLKTSSLLGCELSSDEANFGGKIIAYGVYTDQFKVVTYSVVVFLYEASRIPNERNYAVMFMTDGKLQHIQFYANIVHAIEAYASNYGMGC